MSRETNGNISLVSIEDVDLSYDGSPVIRGLSMCLERGTLVGLIGPNGAGKTTLLKAVSGQFRPERGRICFEEIDIYENNRDYKECIGYVHESPFFYPYLTVEDFMHFIAGIKRVPNDASPSQIETLLRLTDIWEQREKVTSALSMGMRKKLAIAASMIGSPKMLFLDEALNGIDLESTYRIKQALREFVDQGGTVILSTHVLEVVERICDRFVVLVDGEIVADLRADEVAEETMGESLEGYVIKLLGGRRKGGPECEGNLP